MMSMPQTGKIVIEIIFLRLFMYVLAKSIIIIGEPEFAAYH